MAETENKALEPVETEEVKKSEVETKEVKETKAEKKAKKRKYGEVMTTGAFIRTFIILLIPGINILFLILWAIGAAKNKNKVNLSRGIIAFFFIEVLIALILFGAGYIFADQKKDQVFKWANTKTNGVFEYMEIDDYKELPKLLSISKFLIEKEVPEEEENPEVSIPKTSYICNPEGIDNSEEFFKLFEAQFAEKTDETAVENATEATVPTLFSILEDNNVDVESDRIYVIFDTEKENCVIVFNKNGIFEIENYPDFIASKDYVMVGGAK